MQNLSLIHISAIGAVLQIKPLLKIEGELLDACAKVRGTAGCKKKLLETIRGDAERLSTVSYTHLLLQRISLSW